MDYKDYDFDNDAVFQNGKQQLMQSFGDGNQEDNLDKVKQFYFEKFIKNKLNGQKQDKNKVEDNTDNPVESKETKLDFQTIVKLIEEGKPIPGIKNIPLKINEEKPSESKLSPRKKPWQK